jgi:methylmalonyl-CoA mutase C-terminal domain/subunit
MPARVLVAKPGLDGHDRGAKIVARALRDAGYEVIYTGIRQRIEAVATIAIDEDVDLIGLSILSGAHIGLTARLLDVLGARGAHDIPIVVGGAIPRSDADELLHLGAADVFPTGTPIEELVKRVGAIVRPA